MEWVWNWSWVGGMLCAFIGAWTGGVIGFFVALSHSRGERHQWRWFWIFIACVAIVGLIAGGIVMPSIVVTEK